MEKNKSKLPMITSVILVGTIFLAIYLAALSYKKSAKVEEVASHDVITKIVEEQVDYRLTSYDYKFLYTNTVVVDQEGEIIGKLVIDASMKEIDSFYSNPDYFKTKTFNNLKDGLYKTYNDSTNTIE